MKTILMPLPDTDFDVTEVAVPWKLAKDAGHAVVFASATGATPKADPLLVDGVIFGRLGAQPEPLAFYRALEQDPAFRAPLRWDQVDLQAFDGLVLAGGHAQGMRPYLESPFVQAMVLASFERDRPVGAICHGVLVLARTRDPKTGRCVLHGRKTTCLPKYMERSAYLLTAWKLGKYYRTYPSYVEEEVRAALASSEDFVRGPRTLLAVGTADDDRPAFVVEDGNYVSARWPGDAYLFARRFLEKLDAADRRVA